MEFFCHTILGDGLVKRGEIALGTCCGAVGQDLRDALPVDAVAHREGGAVLADGADLVERSVGNGLAGEDAGDVFVGAKSGDGIRVVTTVGVAAHTILLDNVTLGIERNFLRGMGCRSGQIFGTSLKQAVEPVVGKRLLQVEGRVGAPHFF